MRFANVITYNSLEYIIKIGDFTKFATENFNFCLGRVTKLTGLQIVINRKEDELFLYFKQSAFLC